MFIPYFDDNLNKNTIKTACKTLKTGMLSKGKIALKFEKEFLKKLSIKSNNYDALSVSSCTAALHLILKYLNLKKNDEVIVPSLSFVADANTVIDCGAKVIFSDIKSSDDLTSCPKDIKKKINSRTKAVIVMHYGGFPSDILEIRKICKNKKIVLIEDACHALFSSFRNKKLGTFGDFSVFSFYGNKNLSTGEGGMIIGNKKAIQIIKKLSSHGINYNSSLRLKKKTFEYNVDYPGLNYRFDDLRASIGLSELRYLNKKNLKRFELYKNYINLIKKFNLNQFIKIPFKKKISKNLSFHLFSVILKKSNNKKIFTKMYTEGIMLNKHYPLIHKFSFYKKNFFFKLPVAESVADKILSLPIYPNLDFKKQYRIIKVLYKILNEN